MGQRKPQRDKKPIPHQRVVYYKCRDCNAKFKDFRRILIDTPNVRNSDTAPAI